MPRIVPSLIAEAIGKIFPWAKEGAAGRQGYQGPLGPDQAPGVNSVLELLEALPPDLLPTDPTDLLTLEAAKGAMRGALASWSGAPHPGLAAQLGAGQVFDGHSPIVAVLRVLQRCPDEGVTSETPELRFIPDALFRASIRQDIATAFRAFGNGEYKPATVLAGSVLEAILLHLLSTANPQQLAEARQQVDARKGMKLDVRGAEHWTLAGYIAVAQQLCIIDDTTVRAAELTKDFRNLIHPGRALRTATTCTQSTALIALGAMRRIVEVAEAAA